MILQSHSWAHIQRKLWFKKIHVPQCSLQHYLIAKTWKQPNCLLTDEWIKKMWYVYTMEYYSAVKKNRYAICSNMDGPRDDHTKWSKPDKERQILYDITYMWNLKKKKIQMNLFMKQK